MAASDPNVTAAKARMDQGGGEPATGYISPSDIKGSYDDLQAGWTADIVASGSYGEESVVEAGVPGDTLTGQLQAAKGATFSLFRGMTITHLRGMAQYGDGNTYTFYLASMVDNRDIDTILASKSVVQSGAVDGWVEVALDVPVVVVAGQKIGVFVHDSDGNYNSYYNAALPADSTQGWALTINSWRLDGVPADGATGEVGTTPYTAGVRGTVPLFSKVITQVPTFSYSGVPSAPSAGAVGWWNDGPGTVVLQSVRVSAGTAPSGGTLTVDVNVDGFTALPSPLVLGDGASTVKTTALTAPSVPVGSAVTVDVDGNTGSAADVVVQIGAV